MRCIPAAIPVTSLQPDPIIWNFWGGGLKEEDITTLELFQFKIVSYLFIHLC
jgi:hypothetical protein